MDGLSLTARCYIAFAACLLIAAAGTWLTVGSLTSDGGGLVALKMVAGLALIALAVFGIIETAHLTVVATANTIDESVAQVAALLSRAKRQVLIVSGEGNAKFWDRPEVSEPLRDAIDRGVTTEIIIGSQAMATGETLLNLVHSGRMSLYEVAYTPTPHFMVVDSIGFRIESPHPQGAETRQGLGWQRGSMGARILEEEFAAMRAEGTKWGWK